MNIFWVDDDIKSFSRPYYDELVDDGGHKIKVFEEPDSAFTYFKAHHNEFSCAIIDLMLPTGQTFSVDETELGTRTGKFLIDELLKINPKLSIIILSVVKDNEVINWARNKGITYLHKHNTLPNGLSSEVNKLEQGTLMNKSITS